MKQNGRDGYELHRSSPVCILANVIVHQTGQGVLFNSFPPGSCGPEQIYMQYDAVITPSIFVQNPHKIDTPELALMGEIWGVFCEYQLWYMFLSGRSFAVCTFVSYWTALYWHLAV